ncbi:MAG: TolC family protein [Saprospiraceae bacterium]|nr:TolC family protein [Saprospiraceae bacterium]MDW8230304.1 TolC family protein [Saprospiraceae bacterium]
MQHAPIGLFASVLFASTLPSLPLLGQGQAPMRLNDCIQYALDNHPQIKTARLQIADAEWQIKENTGTGLPQIGLGLSYQYFLQRPGIPASAIGIPAPGDEKIFFNAFHSLAPSISVSQLLFSNSYLTSLKAARTYRQYVQLQLIAIQKTLRNQVTEAYLPALLLEENLRILDRNIANLEELLRETQATVKAGFAEQLDADRLQLSLSGLRTERDNLGRQRDIVLDALKMAMGMPLDQPITLADNLEALLQQYASVDPTGVLNFNNRPEYATLLKGRELNALQADLFKKYWMPTLAGFLQYQPGWQGAFGNDTRWFFIPSAIVGVSLSISLWDGGISRARYERAMIAYQTVEVQREMLEQAMTLEVETARRQLLNAAERIRNQQQNLDLARRVYETIQTKYKAGVGSSFELISAEQQLYAAQQALMQAQFDLLKARVALKNALGQ